MFVSCSVGMHAIKEKPVVVNGQIVIRPIMVVALTYDHRLLDGREAVTFLGEFSFPALHFSYGEAEALLSSDDDLPAFLCFASRSLIY